MLREYDIVVLKKALPGLAVPVSAEGTVVMVHDSAAQAYEVEFFDKNNKTIDVGGGQYTCTVVGDEYLELKWAYKDMK